MAYWVRLIWTDNSDNEDDFVVYRQRDANNNLQPHAILPANNIEFIEEVEGGHVYYYEVRARNSAGSSDPSNQVSVSTILQNPVLSISIPADYALQLTWDDPNDLETEVRVYRRLYGTTNWALIATLEEGATSYLDEGLAPATGYDYYVQARNSTDGLFANSNIVSATTLDTAPYAPTLGDAVENAWEDIELSWISNSSNHDGFRVYRRADGGAWTQIYQGTALTFSDDFSTAGPRLEGVLYEYAVAAYNDDGENLSNIVAISSSPIPAPTNVAVSNIQTDGCTLTWTDVAEVGGPGGNESGYRIHISRGYDGLGGGEATYNIAADLEEYVVTGLDDNSGWRIYVGAVNSASGTVSWGEGVSFYTLLAAPDAPSSLIAYPDTQNPTGREGYQDPNEFNFEG